MTPEERAALRRYMRIDEAGPSPTPDAAPPDEAARVGEVFQPVPGAEPQQQPAQQGSWGAVLRDAAIRGITGVGRFAQTVAMPGLAVPMQRMGIDPATIVERGLEQQGMYRTPDAVPTTPAQRYAAAGVEGAAGGLPFGPVGALAGAAGGMAGEAAAEGAGAFGVTPGVQMGARLAGNVVGGAAAPGVANLAGRFFTGPGAQAQAMQRLGMQPRMPAQVSDSAAMQQITHAASRMPGGSGRVAQAAQGALDDLSQAVDDVATRIAGSPAMSALPPQGAGEVVQEGVRNWMGASSVADNLRWNQFWGVVQRAGTTTPLTNTRNTLAQVRSNLARELPDLAQRVDDPLINDMRLILTQNPQSLSIPALREFRTRVGGMLESTLVSSSEDQAALRRIYGALTDDLRDAARRAGALDQFNAANTYTRDRHALIENVANRVLGTRDNPVPPEGAYQWLVGQAQHGGTRLQQAAQTMLPEEMGAVGATYLRQGVAPSGPAAAAGDTSAARMNTLLNDARRGVSPEARGPLFQGQQQAVADLGTVAAGAMRGAPYANPSGTAGAAQWMQTMGGLGTAGGAGLTSVLGGNPVAGGIAGGLGGSLGAPVAGALAGRLASSPMLARHLARERLTNMTGAQGAGTGSLASIAGFLNPEQRRILGLP